MTIRGIVTRAGWMLDDFIWLFAAPVCRFVLPRRPPVGITIGITTYKERFKNCLKPLLPRMHVLFPRDQIIVIVNGHYQKKEQEDYIREVSEYCRRFPNVEVESYIDPRGLSFLWNRLIKRALADDILILNDDIKIRCGFRNFIKRKDFRQTSAGLINMSLSHFKISKNVTAEIGYFDEGFTEIGGEDDDYLARLAIAGIEVNNFQTDTISRRKLRTRGNVLNSYGKDMSEERGGYSTVNSDYLENKWEIRAEPFPGAVEVPLRKNKYWKLRSCHDPDKGATKP